MVEASREALVALAGNPNTGKTTLFNRLTGSDLKVGNYPGVTVDCHTGRLPLPGGRSARLMDVPGTYSLSARSHEEQIAMQAVAGLDPLSPPDLVVCVVDATQMSRNLYLCLQVIEMNVPVIVALTMTDMLERAGSHIDTGALSSALGVPAIATSGMDGRGVPDLLREIEATLNEPNRATPGWRWTPGTGVLAEDIDAVVAALPTDWAAGDDDRRRAMAIWALLSIDEKDELAQVPVALRDAVLSRRAHAEGSEREIETEVIAGRFGWIDEHAATSISSKPAGVTRSERIDRVLLHPVFGFVIFLVLMAIVFQSLFAWADPAIGMVEEVFAALSGWVQDTMSEGFLRDFLTEGLIAGVGSVVVFLPQILLLFLFIGIMEASGYMARVAFLMDRIMKRLGLHGRAFVPMMSGFACAIPAIMATRTMERRRDRMLTMMVVPLMTCSARLPVYTLLIAALFPASEAFGLLPTQGLLMLGMYLFSTLTAFAALFVLSKTLFKGPSVPLLLELPPYRMPHWKSVLRMMWQKGKVFLTDAGGIILVCTIGLWLLLSFPNDPEIAARYETQRETARATLVDEALDAELARIDAGESGELLRSSYGGRFGRAIEPTIEPLGFDWKIGVGLVGAFAAREVFVSTMGVVYGVGDEVDEESATLREKIRSETWADGRPVYTPLVGLSLMIFFALACQCMSTLGAVYRETKSWGWTTFLFVYMTGLAWLASFVTYQGGRLLGFE